jgi:hypothetical protein
MTDKTFGPLLAIALLCSVGLAQIPSIVSATEAEHTTEARMARLEGNVIIDVSFAGSGKTITANVVVVRAHDVARRRVLFW